MLRDIKTNKRTKIVATVSPQTCTPEFIRALYNAGMDAVRINSAHVDFDGAKKIVETVRAVSETIGVILDTKGPEIRTTALAANCDQGIPVNTGDRLTIRGSKEGKTCTPEIIYLNEDGIIPIVPIGAHILIDDGDIELIVQEKTDNSLIVTAGNSGVIKGRKSVNIPHVNIDLPSITDRDREFILWGIKNDIDFIAHSFVRSKEDVLAVKKLIIEHNSPIKIISKIENQQGVDHLDEIISVTYGVMVARGDLGVELPAERIPITQKEIVRKCIASKTPVIIATQMLHSMINNPRPTRAEISDIANAVYERVDAIMLSGETAAGKYPVEAVETMTRVAQEIESDDTHNAPNIDLTMVRINNEITAQLSRSAVRASINLPIKAILIDTLTGRTGRYIAAFRGAKPVYAVCWKKCVSRRLSISYGVHAIYQEPSEFPKGLSLSFLYYLEERGFVSKEDLVVVIGGSFGASKGASYMEIGNILNIELKSLEQ